MIDLFKYIFFKKLVLNMTIENQELFKNQNSNDFF